MEAKPLAELTKTLRVFLKINIAITAIAFLVGLCRWYSYTNLPAGAGSNEILFPSDRVVAIVGLVQFVFFVILGITFLRWIYRINKNLRALSGEQMKFTPGWAVGWYFIPIANLFKPYQAMKEIWRISHKNEPPTYSPLGWWWFLWIVSILVGRLAFRTVMQAGDSGNDIALIYILSDGIDVILNIVGLMVVTRIWNAYSKLKFP
jgi:Domain of unknown function (DUF4328)